MIITKIEPQNKHKNRSSVFLNGAFAFGINDFDLHKLQLKEGQSLSDAELDKIKQIVLAEEAKHYALKLLDRHPYTEQSIRNKLKERGTEENVIEVTISFLSEYHYIDDYDFAKRYITSAIKAGKSGKRKIIYDLIGKGVLKEIAEEVASEFEWDEERAVISVLEKKLKGDYSFENIMKAKRYCLSKGFSYEEVDSAIQRLKSESEY